MISAPIYCTNCSALLQLPIDVPNGRSQCPSCETELEYWLFPSLVRPAEQEMTRELPVEGEATCFTHGSRKAVLVCDHCGRFMCSLCDMEMSGRHLCPSCFQTRQTSGTLRELPKQIVRYDKVCLGLAVIPMFLCCWPAILTAPITLFTVVKYWNAPGSQQTGARVGMIASALIAILQLAYFAFIIFSMIYFRTIEEA